MTDAPIPGGRSPLGPNRLAAPGCLALLVFGLVLLLPFFLANVLLTALARLGLSPILSLVVAAGIFLGGMVNVPVKRIRRTVPVEIPHQPLFGLGGLLPRRIVHPTETVLSVNLGGCVIPALLGSYELYRLAEVGWGALGVGLAAVALNTAVCWRVARPVRGLGIALPALVPALVAAVTALAFLPDMAPPVAFSAGVLGPLLGADLLHLSEIEKLGAGTASIGGAGTFDGIVLSGLVATLLA